MSSSEPEQESAFPLLRLPIHLQERILSLLPVSSLLPLLSVSRSLRSLLRSPSFPPPPPDLFFLLFASASPPFSSLLSFHPSSRRWLSLPLPSRSPLSLARPCATASSLALAFHHSLLALHMFSPLPPRPIPPMLPAGDPCVLALIPPPSPSLDHFKILAATSSSKNSVSSQVYDSRHGKWVPAGQIHGQFVLLVDSALVRGSLYVHAYMPDQLLQFDLISHKWKYVTSMPENMTSSHIFSYGENLYLIAGFEILGAMTAIRVLKLDWIENCLSFKWTEISVVSETEEEFVEFTGGCCWLFHFEAVDRAGLVCLHNSLTNRVLLFDARDMSWILAPPCPYSLKDLTWYGHATEMGLEVLSQGVA